MKKNFFAVKSHEKMTEVNMDKNAVGPEFYYYMVRGGEDKTNISIWETGKVGDEYIKSYGHYHVDNIAETYTILQGSGVILMQKRMKDEKGNPIDNQIEFFKAINVKAGDKVYIDGEMAHLLVNTGKVWLVASDDSPVYPEDSESIGTPKHADYEPIRKLSGFAYYLIEKDGQPTLVQNPNYSVVPQAIIETL